MKKIALAAATAILAIVSAPGAAIANTAPNTYNYVGSSWIDVPDADRVYAETFNGDLANADDASFFYIPAGVTCTYNSISATGPFWETGDSLSSSDCTDANSNPYTPVDNATGVGSYPFGFTINFFGQNVTKAWPNTNGAAFFDAPSNRYDHSVPALIGAASSSGIFPFASDQYFDATESNFWTAHTTVNGHPAVVFSWEHFHNCCTSDDGSANMSYQLVLMDLGGGDFDAWFNYDAMEGFNQGYLAPEFFVDLNSGVTAGSNVVVGYPNVDEIPATCTDASYRRQIGNFTDSAFYSIADGGDDVWVKLEDASANTVSIWSDGDCTTPVNITTVQDLTNDGYAYESMAADPGTHKYSVGMGWGLYDLTNGKITSTELLHNIDAATLGNSGTDPIINRSWNTTVPGRMVLGQRGGVTLGDPNDPASQSGGGGNGGGSNNGGSKASNLAATGFDATALSATALIALAFGAVLMRARRRQY